MAVIQEVEEMGQSIGVNDVQVQVKRESTELSNRHQRAISEQKPRHVPNTADLLQRKKEKLIQEVMRAEQQNKVPGKGLHRDYS